MFRRCRCSLALPVTEQYLCAKYLSKLIVIRSNHNNSISSGSTSNNLRHIPRARWKVGGRDLDMRASCGSAIIKTQGNKPLSTRANVANFNTQQASFISLPGSNVKRRDYIERRILGFSMEQMFEVVSDVERYQEFLPWCQKSLVKSRRKGHIVADLVVGFPPLVEAYTSSVTFTEPLLIRAESTQGKLFNQLITTWKFSPGLKGKPQSCVVDFYVSFEFKSMLTSQLANVFFNEVVRAMAGAFYNEAKRRFGAESIPSRKINIVPSNEDDSNRKS